jgi:hypothetical protein
MTKPTTLTKRCTWMYYDGDDMFELSIAQYRESKKWGAWKNFVPILKTCNTKKELAAQIKIDLSMNQSKGDTVTLVDLYEKL